MCNVTCSHVTAAWLLGLGLLTPGHQGDKDLLSEPPGDIGARDSNLTIDDGDLGGLLFLGVF